jgi:plastocyanin
MPYRCALKLAVPVFAAALWAAPARAADHNVTVGSDFAFHPQTVIINVGDTVIWTNNNAGLHDVRADDGSFATSGGNNFTFSHTFDSAGTVGYHCRFHGGPGVFMFGTVIVQGSGGGDEHGTLRFSQASYSVNEGAGAATINVQRVNGGDGAVSAQFSATAGTATAGQDFTAVTGTLSWADNDDAQKSFPVPIANDSAAEGNQTISLALSNPTGGAVLDNAQKTATLTIVDNDTAPGGTPAAPSNLNAVAQSTSEIELTWNDNSNNEVGFSIEQRKVDGTFQEVAVVGPNVTRFVVPGLDPSTFYLFRVRASGGAVSSPFSNEAGAATFGNIAVCVPGPTNLCLNKSRFRVETDWRIPNGTTGAGQAVALPSAPDSGLFYFFGPDNIEMLIKVLNACVPTLGNRFWVFYAATTNVELAVVVTDTQTGRTKGYYNPLNRTAPPVQDVDAFATCP